MLHPAPILAPSAARRRAARLRLALAGLIISALSACSEPPPPRGMGRHFEPTFQLLDGHEAPTHERLAMLVVGPELAPWEVFGAEGQVVSPEQGPRRLLLLGRDDRVVKIPVEIDPARCNQVVVSGVFPGVLGLKLVLSGEGESKHSTDVLSTRNTQGQQHIVFELPRLRMKRRAFDSLELRILGRKVPQLELASIELAHEPLSTNLPLATGDHGLVMVEHEARHGFGLTSRTPVECEFDVQDADERLGFSYGQPSQFAMKKTEPELELRLFDGAQEVYSETYEVHSDGWRDEDIALAQWAGKTLRCELRVTLDGDQEELIGVSNFRVGRPAENPPTVVLVSSDTHRGDHVGFMSDLVQTPHIDALGARGVIFTDAYAPTNITSPSHVSMMTGLHPRDHRVVSNTGHMTEQAPTLARAFREQGYATIGLVSVRHLGPQGTGLGQGFDRMKAPIRGTWTAGRAVDETLAMMDEFAGRPLFVWLHLFEAHHPYVPPKEFDRRYYDKDKDPFDESLPELGIAKGAIPEDMVTLRDLDYPRAQYRAEIDYLDQELGRLFARPRVQSAVVAVTADHGELLGTQGTYFNHTEIYPEALHIPLVLAGPGVPKGERVETPVDMIDIGRTLLDLAGLARADFPGRQLLVHLEDGDPSRPRFALAAHGASASITRDGWHFMLHLRDHKGALPVARKAGEIELYDLRSDPGCEIDRSKEPDAEAKAQGRELCRLLREWLGQSGGPSLSGVGVQSAANLKALEGLGYTTDSEEVENEEWYEPSPDGDPCGCFE